MRTIVSRFTSCVIAAAVLIASTPNVSAQEEETTQYYVQTILCSVQPGLSFGELEATEYTRTANYERKSEREREKERRRIERVLKEPVNYTGNNLHLRSFLGSFEGGYGLPFVVDNRVVPIRKEILRVTSDADLLQGNPDGTEYVTDGIIDDVNISNMSIEEALQFALKQVNLDYRIEGRFIWITSPEKLKEETFEDFQEELDRERLLLHMDGTMAFFDWQPIRLGESDNMKRDVQRLDQYEKFTVLSRPNIATLEGQPVSINISTEVPYEHLVRMELKEEEKVVGFAFRSETLHEEVGTIIDMMVHKNSVGGLLFDCNAEVSILDGRESVSGTDLPVGKPKIIRVKREIADAEVQPNKWFAMLMNTPSDDILLMLTRIQVKPKEEQTAEAQPEIAITTRWHQALGHFVSDDQQHADDTTQYEVMQGNVGVYALPEGSDSIDAIPDFRNAESISVGSTNDSLNIPSNGREKAKQRKSRAVTKVVEDQDPNGEIRRWTMNDLLSELTPPGKKPVITADEAAGYVFAVISESYLPRYRGDSEVDKTSIDFEKNLLHGGTMLAVTEIEDDDLEHYQFDLRLEYRRQKLVQPRTLFDNEEEAIAALMYGGGRIQLQAEPGRTYALVLPLRSNEYAICMFSAEPYQAPPPGPKGRGGVGGGGRISTVNH